MSQSPIIQSTSYKIPNIEISHYYIDYPDFATRIAKNDTEFVRLHFGLKGKYAFEFKQLNASYELSGHHNNIMYSAGLELAITNQSKYIETFGINFSTDTFVNIAQNGNDTLKILAQKVINKENAILSEDWRTNTFKIQQVIQEIILCPYTDSLKDIFLLSKSLELLVLQADMYQQSPSSFIHQKADRDKLIAAKEILDNQLQQPPTLTQLALLTQLNEYKLKKGFKELFSTTVFGYIHQNRMALAQRLLLDTAKSAKEIAYEIGYSSPQHFSKAFKKEFGLSPNSIRETPN